MISIFKASILTLAIASLAGCASHLMQQKVGMTVTELKLEKGPPVQVLDLPDGRKAYQWREDTVAVVGGYNGIPAYGGTSTCFYTYYASWNEEQDEWVITGFKKPTFDCE